MSTQPRQETAALEPLPWKLSNAPNKLAGGLLGGVTGAIAAPVAGLGKAVKAGMYLLQPAARFLMGAYYAYKGLSAAQIATAVTSEDAIKTANAMLAAKGPSKDSTGMKVLKGIGGFFLGVGPAILGTLRDVYNSATNVLAAATMFTVGPAYGFFRGMQLGGKYGLVREERNAFDKTSFVSGIFRTLLQTRVGQFVKGLFSRILPNVTKRDWGLGASEEAVYGSGYKVPGAVDRATDSRELPMHQQQTRATEPENPPDPIVPSIRERMAILENDSEESRRSGPEHKGDEEAANMLPQHDAHARVAVDNSFDSDDEEEELKEVKERREEDEDDHSFRI